VNVFLYFVYIIVFLSVLPFGVIIINERLRVYMYVLCLSLWLQYVLFMDIEFRVCVCVCVCVCLGVSLCVCCVSVWWLCILVLCGHFVRIKIHDDDDNAGCSGAADRNLRTDSSAVRTLRVEARGRTV